MENTKKMNCVIDLKKRLLERFEGAAVIDRLKGQREIDGKTFGPKTITYYKDIDIANIFLIDWDDVARSILYRFEKKLVYNLKLPYPGYDNLIIGIWGDCDIMYDLKPEEDKIRIIINAYLDAIVI